MKELIERIEKAQAPNLALEWEIHLAVHGIEGAGMYGKHPNYTASLDKALSLVPAKNGWNLQGNTDVFCAVVAGHYSKTCRTPALALCAAALKARAARPAECPHPFGPEANYQVAAEH